MPRRKTTPTPNEPFVVVVRFNGYGKEYHYLCSNPFVGPGSTVLANGTKVTVLRTLASSPLATRYVETNTEALQRERREEILKRLDAIESFERRMTRYSQLTSPEAKRLVRELKELSK